MRLPPQSHGIAKEQSAVKPAFGGLPSSVTVQRSAQHRATFPQGEGEGGARKPNPSEGAEICAPAPLRQGVILNSSLFA